MSVLLAKSYSGQDVTGWLMSEKLDGVRAVWTGSHFVSRTGNVFVAPEWFTRHLPAIRLDGELFCGRGMFQTTVGIVRTKTHVDSDWKTVRYCVFDAPDITGGFEARLAACEHLLADVAIADVVAQTVCTGDDHLSDVFASLCADGAEGVMLRKPGSDYEPKRSSTLLKYKPVDSDEGVVIGSEPGAGRLDGLVGALLLQWNGVVVRVGSGLTDAIRSCPPVVGSAVSFAFNGLTDSGMPRFPVFLTERNYE